MKNAVYNQKLITRRGLIVLIINTTPIIKKNLKITWGEQYKIFVNGIKKSIDFNGGTFEHSLQTSGI